jgi:hypothetical protein
VDKSQQDSASLLSSRRDELMRTLAPRAIGRDEFPLESHIGEFADSGAHAPLATIDSSPTALFDP